ncbi:hypothetical protein JOY44_07475 [Phormidium sp. CLA17]|uniref:hypothetical protein n=1 Tax=Leptolyngbya sp. Cla-17 TaxID=2803751 RepID=UPI0014925153|nr:hypothetical protein [Leptolyngbya sp. Cla-17]MBM0741454.1 hypothetical protein [Leptolyngbya sp. Cla-17]
MTIATADLDTSGIVADDYVVLGLATCFIKEEGEIYQVQVIEPIPSAALEAILKGIATSYGTAIATTFGSVLMNDTTYIPAEFPVEAQFCDDFAFRLVAATRTYKARSIAQTHIPVGTGKSDFNFSIERKRVLNIQRIVRTEDNVKQHEYTHKVL